MERTKGSSFAWRRDRRLLLLALGLVLVGCAAARPPAEPEARPEPDQGPSLLGFSLGAAQDELVAARPRLAFEPEGRPEGATLAELQVDMDGLPVVVGLHVYDGRLYSVSLQVTGAAATIDAYRAIVARAEAGLGEGASTRCESEDGVPFERFLASGQGLLVTEWQDDVIFGRISASRSSGAPGSIEIAGFVSDRRFTPPCDPDLVCGDPPASRQKEGAEGSAVALSSEPAASLSGLAFGSSVAAVEAVLGRPVVEEGSGRRVVPMEIAGVPGELHLSFYDGCLAVLMLVVEGRVATIGAYRSIQAWARGSLGPGEASRCVSEEGVPDAEHVAAGQGSLRTRWTASGPVEASIRLEALYGRREAPEIVFEAEYVPLRSRAPRIDFAE